MNKNLMTPIFLLILAALPSAPAMAAAKVFIEVKADKLTAAVDEPILLTYKLYTRLKAGDYTIDPGTVRVENKKTLRGKEVQFLKVEPVSIKVSSNGVKSRFAGPLEALPSGTGPAHLVLLLDNSPSMLSREIGDGKPTRFDLMKQGVQTFLNFRPQAVITAMTYAQEFKIVVTPETASVDLITLMPSTVDGTALGDALYAALKEFKPDSSGRAIIILTDSSPSNAGNLDPLTAADFAKQAGIPVFTISLGKTGRGLMPVPKTIRGVPRNEDGLTTITIKKDDASYMKLRLLRAGFI